MSNALYALQARSQPETDNFVLYVCCCGGLQVNSDLSTTQTTHLRPSQLRPSQLRPSYNSDPPNSDSPNSDPDPDSDRPIQTPSQFRPLLVHNFLGLCMLLKIRNTSLRLPEFGV